MDVFLLNLDLKNFKFKFIIKDDRRDFDEIKKV